MSSPVPVPPTNSPIPQRRSRRTDADGGDGRRRPLDPRRHAVLVDTAIAEFGRVDIVVNNVGGALPSAFLDTSERSFDTALRFNVTSAFNLTQLAVPHLLESDGSICGEHCVERRPVRDPRDERLRHRQSGPDPSHPRTRAGSLTEGSVNAVSLGGDRDLSARHRAPDPGASRRHARRHPDASSGRPDDIAAAVLFCSACCEPGHWEQPATTMAASRARTSNWDPRPVSLSHQRPAGLIRPT